MFDRAFVVGLALAVAAPVWAQQAAAPQPDDPAKPQVETFEMVLRSAVDRGGQQFAVRASKIWPGIEWEPGEPSIVTGEVVHALGLYVFQIQVAPLTQTSIQVFRLMNQSPRGPRSGAARTESVSNGGGNRVGADGGTVPPDPMAVSPAPGVPIDFDPNRDYSDGVKAELIDALLDRSSVLPVGPAESIVVVAGSDDSSVPVLYRTPARKLVLSIKGSDLLDFREGKITRDEVKQRIKEEHF